MSHFVAAWTPPGVNLDPATGDQLASALSPAGAVTRFATDRVAVAFWDSGLWPGDSVHATDDCRCAVVGDPVLAVGGEAVPRGDAVAHLLEGVLRSPGLTLTNAQGTFAALAWDPSGAMVAATDKLGVRPIYWAQAGRTVYVSTVFWALSAIPTIPAVPDLRGVVETCAFGAPLADRTVTAAVRTLGAGEYIDLTAHAPVVRRYCDWTNLPAHGVPDAELPEYITDAFNCAVDSRLYGQDRAFAFLSGGMDSRLVVSRLRRREVNVFALNFAPPGSQDLLFGRMAAAATGTRLFTFDDEGLDFLARRDRAFKAWDTDLARTGQSPQKVRLVWSGDGGSVGLGHVYLNEEIVRLARSGDLARAAQLIQTANRYQVSARSFVYKHRELADLPLQGIFEDLRSRNGVEAGRNAHLFFMLNDQRRHLTEHFEQLHLHMLDMVLPFFDGRFVTAVCASPVDPFLLHRLYNRIMARQPFGLGQVPWQVYPGHAPCPVSAPESGRLQWQEGWSDRKAERGVVRERMMRSLRFVLSSRFPSDVLSRANLTVAATAGLLGWSQYGHLLKPIGPVCAAHRIAAP